MRKTWKIIADQHGAALVELAMVLGFIVLAAVYALGALEEWF